MNVNFFMTIRIRGKYVYEPVTSELDKSALISEF
jgi:hypothetical protein